MKRILFVLFTFCFILNGHTATQNSSDKKAKLAGFKAVHWKLSLAESAFTLKNNTDRNEIIQITYKSGGFYTYKENNDSDETCVASFGGDSHQLSSVCVLTPGEELHIQVDSSTLKDAEGTYQIAFAK